MEKLMSGDSSQLRLNYIDWSKNEEFGRKSVNTLAENLLSRSVKKMELQSSLG